MKPPRSRRQPRRTRIPSTSSAWRGPATTTSFQGFIDKHGLTFPQISDDPGDVFDRFGVSYQPAIVVVNTDGSTELLAGAVDPALLDQVISEAN